MPITHVTAHHLEKLNNEDAVLTLRNTELSQNTQQNNLFDALKASFNTRVSRKHGSFDENTESVLLIKEIQQVVEDENTFHAATITLMNAIENAANEHNAQLNAHFLFFMEHNEKQKLFYLFIVNQNEMLSINDTLEITPSYSIDTGSSLSGLKLNITDWQERPKYHYLTLVPPKGNEVLSDALHDISGFGNYIDKAKSTRSFLDSVEAFAENVPEEKQKEYRAKVIEYCEEQEAKDEAVHIPTLSKNLEGIDVDEFIRQMLPNNPVPDDSTDENDEEIMLDRRSLRRYVKFSGRDKDLSITFSTVQLNDTIFYEADTDTLIIKNIPKGLKKQLVTHNKKTQ